MLPDKSLGRIIPVGLPGFTLEHQLGRLDSMHWQSLGNEKTSFYQKGHSKFPCKYVLQCFSIALSSSPPSPSVSSLHLLAETTSTRESYLRRKGIFGYCSQFDSTTITQHSNIQPFLFLPWENQSNQFHQLQDETMAASGPLLKPLNIWQVLLQGGWFLGSFAHHWSFRSEHLQVNNPL